MIECNSVGLMNFWELIKRGFNWLSDTGKNAVLGLISWFQLKWKQLRELVHDYAVKDARELTSGELKGQLENMARALRVVVALSVLVVCRDLYKRMIRL